MTSKQPTFKQTTIFDWDSEPAEERPSAFEHSTYSSAYAPLPRTQRRKAINAFAIFMVVGSLGLGAAVMYGFASLIRG